MKLSIRSRLILSFVAVIALVLFCQLGFNLFFAKGYYFEYQEGKMYSAYEQLQLQFDGTVESIEAVAATYENTNNLEVIVWVDSLVWYTSYDRLLYGTSDHQENGGVPLMLPNITGQVVQQERESLIVGGTQNQGRPQNSDRPENNNGQNEAAQNSNSQNNDGPKDESAANNTAVTNVLHFADQFEYQGQMVTVELTVPIDSIESSAEVFSRSSLLISMIALVIGLGYSLILSKTITKPILEMEQIAGEFANLDFSRKVDESVTATELYHLSKSLNSMSTQLEHAISSLNIANEQLQHDIDYQKQIEQMRREFVGNVSHEMKTPLTMLQIYAESLKNNIDSVDKDYYCDTIVEETETLNDLVASMLDISSIESGLSKMQMEELDLSFALSSLLERMQPLLVKYPVTSEIEPELVLQGDGKYLEQAMKNYITNAMEHTIQGGEIRISLRKENDSILYCVENQGTGVAQEDMLRIWDSFYRADKARNREHKNVGLGLHIVKTVVEKHGGTCACENTQDGVKFYFCLPYHVDFAEKDAK